MLTVRWTMGIGGAGRVALALLAGTMLGACETDGAGAVVPGAIERDVLAAVERYYADFSDRDWDAFAAHFWPGATLATVWQPPGEAAPRVVVTTVEDFVAQAPYGPGSREIFEERMLDADVRVQGDLAHVWAGYEARFGDPGDIIEWRGIDAFTLIRHDGEWRIVSLGYTHLND